MDVGHFLKASMNLPAFITQEKEQAFCDRYIFNMSPKDLNEITKKSLT